MNGTVERIAGCSYSVALQHDGCVFVVVLSLLVIGELSEQVFDWLVSPFFPFSSFSSFALVSTFTHFRFFERTYSTSNITQRSTETCPFEFKNDVGNTQSMPVWNISKSTHRRRWSYWNHNSPIISKIEIWRKWATNIRRSASIACLQTHVSSKWMFLCNFNTVCLRSAEFITVANEVCDG